MSDACEEGFPGILEKDWSSMFAKMVLQPLTNSQFGDELSKTEAEILAGWEDQRRLKENIRSACISAGISASEFETIAAAEFQQFDTKNNGYIEPLEFNATYPSVHAEMFAQREILGPDEKQSFLEHLFQTGDVLVNPWRTLWGTKYDKVNGERFKLFTAFRLSATQLIRNGIDSVDSDDEDQKQREKSRHETEILKAEELDSKVALGGIETASTYEDLVLSLARIGITEDQFNRAADAELKRYDTDNNGFIDRTELAAATRAMLGLKTRSQADEDAAEDPEQLQRRVQQLFEQLDTDHNGKLDAKEFKFFTATLLVNMKMAEVNFYVQLAELSSQGNCSVQ